MLSQSPGFAQEKLGMCVHEAVSHGGPVIEAMVRAANPRLFFVVASDQRRIKGRDRLLDRRPFPLTVSIFGGARLQASLVRVRARIPDVLIAVCLGKEEAQADATCQRRRFAASRPLARAIAVAKSTTSLNGVAEFCALAGGACMMLKTLAYSSRSGSLSASKYAGGIANLLGLPILDGSASVRSLYALIMLLRAR